MHKLVHQLTLLTAIGIVIMLMPAYSATITTYTDSSAFSSVATSLATVDFSLSGTIKGSTYSLSQTSSGLTLTDTDGDTVNFLGTYGSSSDWTELSWWSYTSQAVLTGYEYSSTSDKITITLSAGSTAIGFYIMTASDPTGNNKFSSYPISSVTITLSDGTTETISGTSYNSPIFVGITSDSDITSIVLSVSSGTVVLSSFEVGEVASTDTPEAATMFLLGGGLLMLPAAGRFRRRREAQA